MTCDKHEGAALIACRECVKDVYAEGLEAGKRLQVDDELNWLKAVKELREANINWRKILTLLAAVAAGVALALLFTWTLRC